MPGGIMMPNQPPPPKDPSEAGLREADTSLPTSSSSTTVCKVCNKDMENKYFLRAHMMNEHGVLHTEEPQQEDGKQQQQQPPRMEDERMPPLINGLDMANAQDFAAKFLQQMQKGLGAAAGLPPLDGDDRNFLERVKNELANAGQGVVQLGGNGGHPMGSPSPTGLSKKLGQLGQLQPGGIQ